MCLIFVFKTIVCSILYSKLICLANTLPIENQFFLKIKLIKVCKSEFYKKKFNNLENFSNSFFEKSALMNEIKKCE